MEHGSATLFEHLNTMLNFWNMLLCACTVHCNTQSSLDWFHDWFKFVITLNSSDAKSCIIAPSKYLVHGSVARVDCSQIQQVCSSILDVLGCCHQEWYLVNKDCIHTWIHVFMFLHQFFGDTDLIAHHWCWL